MAYRTNESLVILPDHGGIVHELRKVVGETEKLVSEITKLLLEF